MHSPSSTRPGAISTNLRDELREFSYELAVNYANYFAATDSLIEVYPHPALLTLLECDYRIPYKVARRGDYWPRLTNPERINRLKENFHRIHTELAQVIQRIPDFISEIPCNPTFASLKRYEDALDALVCAWVGARYLEGNATAYGDGDAAIWVP